LMDAPSRLLTFNYFGLRITLDSKLLVVKGRSTQSSGVLL